MLGGLCGGAVVIQPSKGNATPVDGGEEPSVAVIQPRVKHPEREDETPEQHLLPGEQIQMARGNFRGTRRL